MGLHLYIPVKHLQSSKKGKVVLIFSLSDIERDFDQKKKNTSDQETVLKIDCIFIMMGKN